MSDSRRRVTYAQLEQLWEFLNRRKEVALGFNKSAQARHYSRRSWEEVTLILNAHGDGAVKDSSGWCKYWNDYKSKLKRLAVNSRLSHRKTGGGPRSIKPMTEIEAKFLEILGPDFGSGLDGIRVEPFLEEPVETPELSSVPTASTSSQSASILTGVDFSLLPQPSLPSTPSPPQSLILTQSIVRQSPRNSILVSSPSNFSHRRRPPAQRITSTPVTITPTAPTNRTAPTAPTRAESVGRRARHARREPPMSAESARRALIEESRQQTRLEEEKVGLMRELLREFRELKEMIMNQMRMPRDVGAE